MSRSYKKYAIYKDAGGYGTYYRKIRSRVKTFIRTYKREFINLDFDKSFPKEKEIVNDYDVCDWECRAEFWPNWNHDLQYLNKMKRK